MDEQMMQQIQALVQAALSGDEQAKQQISQIAQAALSGDLQAAQLFQVIQQVAQQMQGLQTQYNKLGAKLNYIRQLRGLCPDGYEMKYFKEGGRLCKKCMKKQNGSTIENFKNSRKRNVKKNSFGDTLNTIGKVAGAGAVGNLANSFSNKNPEEEVTSDKCGAKIKKKNKINKGEPGIKLKKYKNPAGRLPTSKLRSNKTLNKPDILEKPENLVRIEKVSDSQPFYKLDNSRLTYITPSTSNIQFMLGEIPVAADTTVVEVTNPWFGSRRQVNRTSTSNGVNYYNDINYWR